MVLDPREMLQPRTLSRAVTFQRKRFARQRTLERTVAQISTAPTPAAAAFVAEAALRQARHLPTLAPAPFKIAQVTGLRALAVRAITEAAKKIPGVRNLLRSRSLARTERLEQEVFKYGGGHAPISPGFPGLTRVAPRVVTPPRVLPVSPAQVAARVAAPAAIVSAAAAPIAIGAAAGGVAFEAGRQTVQGILDVIPQINLKPSISRPTGPLSDIIFGQERPRGGKPPVTMQFPGVGEQLPSRDTVVKVWDTGTARFAMLLDGRIAVQKKDGRIKIYRPQKHIVIPRNPRLGTFIRAEKRLKSISKRIRKVVK